MNETSKKTQLEQLVNRKATSLATPAILANKYTIIARLGQGTQGNVYEAERLSDHARVAIKQLRIDSVTNWKAYDLFQRESEVLASLDVQGVAQFYESIEDLTSEKPAAYLVQQYIRGRSLDDMMKTGYRMTISRVFELALQLLNILEALHTHEPPIIHRDIKPSNILLQPAGGDEYKLYLIDFGAVANPMVQAGGSTVAGTYGYMPPEQLVGRPVASSDLYAMGATLAYMLSGVEPACMSVQDFRLVIDPHLENVPRAIVTTLHQLLDPNPDNRLNDFEQLRKRFTDFSKDRFILGNMPALSDKETAQKLASIKRFNQPGCLDLWMQLPETTPRTVLPEYQTFINSLNLDASNYITPEMLTDKFITEGIAQIVKDYIIAYINGIFIIFIMMRVVFFMFICFAIIYTILIIIIASIKLKTVEFEKKKKRHNEQFEKEFGPLKNQIAAKLDCIHTLMTKGSKAIATIVSCTYQSTGADTCLLPLPDLDLQKSYTTSAPPTFEVTYKFNPPDDDNPNDLFHTIYIHHDITHDFVIGAPLPILYYVLPPERGETQRTVISIPYPLPNDPSLSLSDIIGGFNNRTTQKRSLKREFT